MGFKNPLIPTDFLLDPRSGIVPDIASLCLLLNIRGEELVRQDFSAFMQLKGEINEIIYDGADTNTGKVRKILERISQIQEMVFSDKTIALIGVRDDFEHFLKLAPAIKTVFPNFVTINKRQDGAMTPENARLMIRHKTGSPTVDYAITSNVINYQDIGEDGRARIIFDTSVKNAVVTSANNQLGIVIAAANITKAGGKVIHVVNYSQNNVHGLNSDGHQTFLEASVHLEQSPVVKDDLFHVFDQNADVNLGLAEIRLLMTPEAQARLRFPSAQNE